MNEAEFVRQSQDEWSELVRLAQAIEHAPQKADRAVLERFLTLYRSVGADLSRARAEASNPDLVHSVNNVMLMAQATLYRRAPEPLRDLAKSMFASGAQSFRKCFPYVLASLAFFIAGIVSSVAILNNRPDLRYQIVSPEEESLFKRWTEGKHEKATAEEASTMWIFYATNNPRASALAGSIGATTFGVGSVWFMWRTGSQLGALGSDMQRAQKLPFLVTSLAAHGASELSGAIVASSAGLVLGGALIAPGRRRRGDAIRDAGKHGLTLLGMGILMMYVAAPFEAFFSFRPEIDQSFKGMIGILVFGLWIWYWSAAGREPKLPKAEPVTPATATTT